MSPLLASSAQEHILDRLAADGHDVSELQPVGTRPDLDDYIVQLWERRHFIWVDSRKRVASKYSNSKLGQAWFILQPLLDAAFYGLIFGVVLGAGRGVGNYVGFLIIGIMMFRATGVSISAGTGAISGAKAMIRAFNFPRASIPLSLAIRTAVESVPTLAVLLVMIVAIPPHELPTMTWLLVPVIWMFQMITNFGIILVTSRLGHMLPDSSYILGFVSRIFMYGSGVMFPVDRFVTHPTALFFVQLNPVYQILSMYRMALMDNQVPTFFSWLVVLAWAVFLVIGGGIFFWRGEASYGR